MHCKEWNSGGVAAPLTDIAPYGAEPDGVWFNRVHSFEAGSGADGRTVHFPRSCHHCENPACVTVCPTGASYKRAEDGIVLVNEDLCIGCKLCSWACPYGAREYDYDAGVMKKCTLCIDRIYNEALVVGGSRPCLRRHLPVSAPATSAISAIRNPTCRNSSKRAAAMRRCPSSTTSRSTAICRRVRGPRRPRR